MIFQKKKVKLSIKHAHIWNTFFTFDVYEKKKFGIKNSSKRYITLYNKFNAFFHIYHYY